VIEPLLTVFFLTVGKWLPGNALNAILQSGGGGPESNPADFASVPVGIAVLVGYTVVFAIAAAFITNERDIT
jgi:hypothetical protein